MCFYFCRVSSCAVGFDEVVQLLNNGRAKKEKKKSFRPSVEMSLDVPFTTCQTIEKNSICKLLSKVASTIFPYLELR